jgi:hypothetical protein
MCTLEAVLDGGRLVAVGGIDIELLHDWIYL